MSTSLQHLPRPVLSQLARAARGQSEQPAPERALRALFAQLPSPILRRLFSLRKGTIRLVPSRSILPPEASCTHAGRVFAPPAVCFRDRVVVDIGSPATAGRMAASILSAAGIASASEAPLVKRLQLRAFQVMQACACRGGSRGEFWRRVRSRMIAAGITPAEALVEEAFAALDFDFSRLEALRPQNLRRIQSGGASHPEMDGLGLEEPLAVTALALAWRSMLRLQGRAKRTLPWSRCRISAGSARAARREVFLMRLGIDCEGDRPFAADVFDHPQLAASTTPLRVPGPGDFWPGADFGGNMVQGLYFPRIPTPELRAGKTYFYDPATTSLGGRDFCQPFSSNTQIRLGAPGREIDIEAFEGLCRQPASEIALFELPSENLQKDGSARGSHPVPALLTAACFCKGSASKMTLPPIPSLRFHDLQTGILIESVRSTNHPALPAMRLRMHALGVVDALCSSWVDQCEKLRLNTPYRASLSFWASRIEPAASSCSGARTGVLRRNPGTAQSELYFLAGAVAGKARIAKGVMVLLEARLDAAQKLPDTYVVVSEALLKKLDVKPGAPLLARGVFVCENFTRTSGFMTTGEELNQIPRAFLPPAAGEPRRRRRPSIAPSERLMTPQGISPDNRRMMRRRSFTELEARARTGDTASLMMLYKRLPNARRTQAARSLSLEVDRIVVHALACGSEGAYEVLAASGMCRTVLGPDLAGCARRWFLCHGRSARAIVEDAAPEFFALLKDKGDRGARALRAAELTERIEQAAWYLGDMRAMPFFARLLDYAEALQRPGALRKDEPLNLMSSMSYNMLKMMYDEKLADLAGAYVTSCYERFGRRTWETTFAERLSSFVEEAAAGPLENILAIASMLDMEGGALGGDFEAFVMRPGLIEDETRPDNRTLRIAAMKLMRWFHQKMQAPALAEDLDFLSEGDWRQLGSQDEVLSEIQHFDLWGFLGRELKNESLPLAETAIAVEREQLLYGLFWSILYLEKEADEQKKTGIGGGGAASAGSVIASQVTFILSHCSSFYPVLPSTQDIELSETVPIMRYGPLDAPLERSALFVTLPATLPSEKSGTVMELPSGLPYFSETTAASALLLEAAASRGAFNDGGLRVQLLSPGGEPGLPLAFTDICWTCLEDEYKCLQACTVRFYVLAAEFTALSPEQHHEPWTPSTNNFSLLSFVGQVKSVQTDWTAIAGVSFDRCQMYVPELDGIVENGIVEVYWHSKNRPKQRTLRGMLRVSGFVYGYVESLDRESERKRKLN